MKIASKSTGVSGEGITGIRQVLLIVLLLRIRGCRRVLGTRVNHYLSLATNPLIQVQQTGILRLLVYERSPKPVFLIQWDRVPTGGFTSHIERARAMAPWQDDEFIVACEGMPSPDDLWTQMP